MCKKNTVYHYVLQPLKASPMSGLYDARQPGEVMKRWEFKLNLHLISPLSKIYIILLLLLYN